MKQNASGGLVTPTSNIDPKSIVVGSPASTTFCEPASEPATTGPGKVIAFPGGGRPEGGEGGKGGEIPVPSSPPFPPSPPPPAENASPPSRPAATGAGTVYFPAPLKNPVVQALREAGLYVRQSLSGAHEVRCPWASEHEPDGASSATYTEPRGHLSLGEFTCSGHHDEPPHIGHLLEHLGLSDIDARRKPVIRMVPGEMLAVMHAAETALTAIGGYYQAGGAIATVKEAAGDARAVVLTEQALTKALALAAEWHRFEQSKKRWRRTDPYPQFVKLLHCAQHYELLPVLNGIARQPYFRKSDDALITARGYDADAGVLAVFDPADFPLPPVSEQAARHALAELKLLLHEFPFATDADRSAALAVMLTAAVRPSLPLAPAFNITASTPGTGKSYLANLFALFAGPGDPFSLSYPTTADEATKSMLAAFINKPAVISFDDMQGDWLPHGMMNRMLTSETVGGRVLGESRTIEVATNALIMGTGNNVFPVRDMCRRVITIQLRPLDGSPATRRFRDNPVQKVRANRGYYVALALTIIRAWRNAGHPKSDLPDIATFGAWSDMCRHPLSWLGEPDPATSLIEQVRTDPDAEMLGRFLFEWRQVFGKQAVTLRKLLEEAERDGRGDLNEAIMDLPITDHGKLSRSKLGWFLKKNAHRVAGGMYVQKAEHSERNAWSVITVDPAALPAALPPEPEQDISSQVWETATPPADQPTSARDIEVF